MIQTTLDAVKEQIADLIQHLEALKIEVARGDMPDRIETIEDELEKLRGLFYK